MSDEFPIWSDGISAGEFDEVRLAVRRSLRAYLVARDSLFGELRRKLTDSKLAAIAEPTDVHGFGRIGKTFLTIQYVAQSFPQYHDIRWVRADSQESVMAGLAQLTRHHLAAPPSYSNRSSVSAEIKRSLARQPGVLLIFDNATDLTFLQDLYSPSSKGHILVTGKENFLADRKFKHQVLPITSSLKTAGPVYQGHVSSKLLSFFLERELVRCPAARDARPQFDRFVRQLIDVRQRHLGSGHPEVAEGLHYLCLWLFEQGEYEKAKEQERRSLDILESKFGSNHPFLLDGLHMQADCCLLLGEYQEAERHEKRAQDIVYTLRQKQPATFISLAGQQSRGTASTEPHGLIDLRSKNADKEQLEASAESIGPIPEDHAAQSDKSTTPATMRAPRYVNLWVTTDDISCVLDKTQNLLQSKRYMLCLNVGKLSAASIVENASQHPFPDQQLPETETGHWLEVIAVSDHVRLERTRFHLFLPKVGNSWVCGCAPNSTHTCDPSQRRDNIYISFTTRDAPGSVAIRLGIYYAKNLLQSQFFRATVCTFEEEAGEGHTSWIDYTLTDTLTDIDGFSPRTCNILVNDNEDGSHRIVINGPGADLSFRLTEDQLRSAIVPARHTLGRIHFREYGGQFGGQKQRENLYDSRTNSKDKEKFTEDLRRLAPLGQDLWIALLDDKEYAWDFFNNPSTIQVSRVVGNRFIYPWALVYDIPLERGAPENYFGCRILREWEDVKKELAKDALRECPYKGEHRENILCPFGFWGFRHIIEQPPSVPKNWSLPREIRAANTPPQMVVGVSLALDAVLTGNHFTRLGGLKYGLRTCDSVAALKAALKAPVETLYFYCHGETEEDPAGQRATRLTLGKNDKFYAQDISVWRRSAWKAEHWKATSPLVFLNGCHTTDITPELLLSFVDSFSNAYAAGVLGTEITIDQNVASEIAELFFEGFRSNMSVGESLHKMRIRMLAKNNLLGLAYTAYCSADLRLSCVA